MGAGTKGRNTLGLAEEKHRRWGHSRADTGCRHRREDLGYSHRGSIQKGSSLATDAWHRGTPGTDMGTGAGQRSR